MLFALLAACSPYAHPPTAEDACLDEYELFCECGDTSSTGGEDPCALMDDGTIERQYCAGAVNQSDGWREWQACRNVAYQNDCALDEEELAGCGDSPE